MKKLIIVLFISFIGISGYTQEMTEAQTQMEAFASKTGSIVRFVDYNTTDINLTYGVAETRVRELISGGEVRYFYVISYKSQYDTHTASIAYEELLEVMSALEKFVGELNRDIGIEPDYLENKFITEDGFKIGYYVEKKKYKWFLVLDRYSSKGTVFVNDVSTIAGSLNMAKAKIEELKNRQ